MKINTSEPPKITAELKSAVETYLLAKAHVQMVEPIVRGYQRAILAEKRFPLAQEWIDLHTERGDVLTDEDLVILGPEQIYLMEDADAEQIWPLFHQAHIDHGFGELVGEGTGFCPLSIAENDLREAKRLVIDASTYIHGVESGDPGLWCREKNGDRFIFDAMVDTMVGLVLSLHPEINRKSVLKNAGIPEPA